MSILVTVRIAGTIEKAREVDESHPPCASRLEPEHGCARVKIRAGDATISARRLALAPARRLEVAPPRVGCLCG